MLNNVQTHITKKSGQKHQLTEINSATIKNQGYHHRMNKLIRVVKLLIFTHNVNISTNKLTSEGRVYGGGLFKLEPKELANVDAEDIFSQLPRLKSTIKIISNQLNLNI